MITFDTFIKLAPSIMKQRLPILLRGRHGIGKSEVVRQIAKNEGLKFISRRVSQMTEGDLIGLPIVNGDTTKWLPPDWFMEACNYPALLFLDEVDRGSIEVRQAVFELNDSRCLNGFNLHKDTVVFAAVNGGKHGENYQVGTMDPAELDRYAVFDLEPDESDWLRWAKTDNEETGKPNIHPLVVSFIDKHHKALEYKGEIEPGKVYPSRRSWKRLSDVVAGANMLDNGGSNLLSHVSTAFLGIQVATEFADFVKNYKIMISAEDILNGKATKMVEALKKKGDSLPDSEQMATLERFIDHVQIMDASTVKKHFSAGSAVEQTAVNVASFFGSFSSEKIVGFLAKLQSSIQKNETLKKTAPNFMALCLNAKFEVLDASGNKVETTIQKINHKNMKI